MSYLDCRKAWAQVRSLNYVALFAGFLFAGNGAPIQAAPKALAAMESGKAAAAVVALYPVLSRIQPADKRERAREGSLLMLAHLGRPDLLIQLRPSSEGRQIVAYMSASRALERHDLAAARQYIKQVNASHRQPLSSLLAVEPLYGLNADELRQKASELSPAVDAAWQDVQVDGEALVTYGPVLALAKFRLGDTEGAQNWFRALEKRIEKIAPEGDGENRYIAWHRLFRAESAAGLGDSLLIRYPKSALIREIALQWQLTEGNVQGAKALLDLKTVEEKIGGFVHTLSNFDESLPADDSKREQAESFNRAVSTYHLTAELLPLVKNAEQRVEYASRLAYFRASTGYPGESLKLLESYVSGEERKELEYEIKQAAFHKGIVPLDVTPQVRAQWLREIIAKTQSDIKRLSTQALPWDEYVELVKYQLAAGNKTTVRETLLKIEKEIGPPPKLLTPAQMRKAEVDDEIFNESQMASEWYPELARLWVKSGNPTKAQAWIQRAVKYNIAPDFRFALELAKTGYWTQALNILLREPSEEPVTELLEIWMQQKPGQFPTWIEKLKSPELRFTSLLLWISPIDDPYDLRKAEFLYQQPANN